jgi:hypothetical protein
MDFIEEFRSPVSGLGNPLVSSFQARSRADDLAALSGVALFSVPKVPLGNAENYGVRPR